MLRTFLVGFGRSGQGLHWPVLRRLRAERRAGDGSVPWSAEPPLVWDVRDIRREAAERGLSAVDSLAEAARRTDPARTVVHLCTPPAGRPELLQRLAELGFTHILAEKPLSTDLGGLTAIDDLVRAYGLSLRVVSPWLFSALTGAVRETIASGRLGALRGLEFRQLKPRWSRTLRADDHPTAFDVELPHSLGVALHLAGDAEVRDAEWQAMHLGERIVPRMGGARLVLRHTGGSVTQILSDLTAPIRERRVTARFDEGYLVGHYPISDADHYAQWSVTTAGRTAVRDVRYDNALAACLREVYREVAARADADGRPARASVADPYPGQLPDHPGAEDFALGRRVVQLLREAKLHAATQPEPALTAPTSTRPHDPVTVAAHDA